MDDVLRRLEAKLRAGGIRLRKRLDESHIQAFELRHGVRLPEGYRRFIAELGDGGPIPPYGLLPLGRRPKGPFTPEFLRPKQSLPFVASPFPFTRGWNAEDGEESAEGEAQLVAHGNLLLAHGGCGIEWRLIVTGPERGSVWEICDAGLGPAEPRSDFLDWCEDHLDQYSTLR